MLPIGAFGRARLWRRGDFALGLSATLSRMDHSASRNYMRPPAKAYALEQLSWSWEPGYLAAGALTAEVGGSFWSFRVEAGLGYILNDPSCSYAGGATSYAGDCKSAEIPDAYHFAVEPGRVIPSLTASLGLRLGGPVAVDESYRSPGTARLLALSATLVPLGIGALLWSSNENTAALAVGAAGRKPLTGRVIAGRPRMREIGVDGNDPAKTRRAWTSRQGRPAACGFARGAAIGLGSRPSWRG